MRKKLTPQERKESTLELSDLVTRIATYVICHTIVNHQDLLAQERLSIAHAFLQRVTTSHMCNHKLTAEGIVYQYRDIAMELHESFRTMTLTRTVYEHLVMFYFLFAHPTSAAEREQVWRYWQAEGKIAVSDGHGGIRQLSYSQAWKYLFADHETNLLYSQLSMHCHPVYKGLLQYQSQASTDEGDDAVPLYLSCIFVSYLCQLYLRLLPDGSELIRREFGEHNERRFLGLTKMRK